ncbi:hypothetical protein Scel_27690 [Streptomyces cellostaticus]|nr:hypothetical protein Scel_27690 [Streptomyces cellostaticus]
MSRLWAGQRGGSTRIAWDEWEQLKAEAAKGQSTHMQSNQLPADSGGGGNSCGDLTVHQKDLAAIGGLKSERFALGAALDHVAEH